MLRASLVDRPPPSVAAPTRPKWPADVLYEWYLLRLDDKAYANILRTQKIEGTNLPSSGDPSMDADIAKYYEELKAQKRK